MGIKRYVANKDGTITNAFLDDLETRATGSNMGASDVLEVFSIIGQASFVDKSMRREFATERDRLLALVATPPTISVDEAY